MSSHSDFDFVEPPSGRQPEQRTLLPGLLLVAGVGMALLLIAGGATVFFLLRQADVAAGPGAVANDPVRLPQASVEDGELLGWRLEQAVMSGDVEAIESLFDWSMMVRRAASGLEMNAADLDSFAAGVSRGASKVATERLVAIGRDGGRFDYLRTIRREGRVRTFCRIITPEGTVDFLEYLPIGRNESLRVGDAFAFSTGEDVSASLRRVLLPLVAHENRSLLERLTGAESDLVRHNEAFGELVSSNLEGRWQETLDVYESLPDSLQREKYALLTVLHAASWIDDTRYVELVETFRTTYPDDAALDLILINYHTIRGELNDAIAALRRLDQRVGGDAFIKSWMADLLIEQQQFAAADALLRQAIQSEPELSFPYLRLVGSAVAAENYEQAVERLEEFEGAAIAHGGDGLRLAALREALAVYPGSEAFFGSKPFAGWQSNRPHRR